MSVTAPLSFLVHSTARGKGPPGLREVGREGVRNEAEPAIKGWLLSLKPRQAQGRCMAFRSFKVPKAVHEAGALQFALAMVDCGFHEESAGRSVGELYLALLTPERDDGSGLEALALVDCATRLADEVPRHGKPLDSLLAHLEELHKTGIALTAPDPARLSQLPDGALRSFLRCAHLALPDPDRGHSSQPEWLPGNVASERLPATIAIASGALPVNMRHVLSWSYEVAGGCPEGLAVRQAAAGEGPREGPPVPDADAYATWLEARLGSRDGRREISLIVQDSGISSWDHLMQAIRRPAAPDPRSSAASAASAASAGEFPRDDALPAASSPAGPAAESAWWNQQSKAIERRLHDYFDEKIEDLRQSLPGAKNAGAAGAGRAPGAPAVQADRVAAGRPYKTYALAAAALVLALLVASTVWLDWRLGQLGRRIDKLERRLAAGSPSSTTGSAGSLATVESGGAAPAERVVANTAAMQHPQLLPPDLAATWHDFLADRQHLAALCKRVAQDPLTTEPQRSFLTRLRARLQAGGALSAEQAAALRTLLFEYAACLNLPGLRQRVDRRWDSHGLTDKLRAQLLATLSAADSDLAHAGPGRDWEEAVILRWATRE